MVAYIFRHSQGSVILQIHDPFSHPFFSANGQGNSESLKSDDAIAYLDILPGSSEVNFRACEQTSLAREKLLEPAGSEC